MTWTFQYGQVEEATDTTQPVIDALYGISVIASFTAKVATCDSVKYPSHWVVIYNPDLDPASLNPNALAEEGWQSQTWQFNAEDDTTWKSNLAKVVDYLNALDLTSAGYAKFSMTDAENHDILLQLFVLTPKEQLVGNFVASDGSDLPDLGWLAPYKSWENIASSLLAQAASASNFQPTSATFDSNAWKLYDAKVQAIPEFGNALDKSGSFSAQISATSFANALTSVYAMLAGWMTAANFDTLTEKILPQIGQLAATNKNGMQKISCLQMGFIARNQGQLHAGYLRTSVTMESASGNGYLPQSQTISIYFLALGLHFDTCLERLEEDMLEFCDADTWANNTNTASLQPADCAAWSQPYVV